ncbi:hypothetical protein MalM14_41200 [Gimesia chilikensis]|nr:hypothetical protein MalM14_41200 [Gimesia chilikensis]
MLNSYRFSIVRYIGLTFLFLFIAYVLSFGPVAAYIAKLSISDDQLTYETQSWIEAFYTPLFWGMKNNNSFMEIMQGYTEMWCHII